MAISNYFNEDYWTIGIVPKPIEEILSSDNDSFFEDIIPLYTPKNHYLADPQWNPKMKSDEFYCEKFEFGTQTGTISKVEVEEDYSIKESDFISTDHHLSFPFIFEDSDELLIIPEQAASGKLKAYNSSAQEQFTLLDEPIIDPVIYQKDGVYFLFGGLFNQDENEELHLFYSDKISEGWTRVQSGPILKSKRGARMAGPILGIGEKIYRFGQNCQDHYGEGIELFEILELSKDGYKEKLIKSISAPQKFKGIHTICRFGNHTLIDVKTRKFSPVKPIQRIKEKIEVKDKIVHILYSGIGGTMDYVLNLVEGDVNQELEHHIIFFGIEEVSKEHLEQAKKSAAIYVIVKQHGKDKLALSKLKETLELIQPKSISLHVNSLIAFYHSWFPKKEAKLLFVEHQAHHLKSKKEWVYSFLAQRRAHLVISLTDFARATLSKKLLIGFKESKNVIITTGINLEVENSKEQEDFSICMVGRFNDFRDQETLIRAAIETECKVVLAGEGPTLNQLRSQYKNKNVEFLGNIGPNQIQNLLAKSSAYFQASFGETSSLSVMQAQSHSLPIIATKVPGLENFLNETNSIQVEAKNQSAYQTAILQLKENVDLRNRLGQESRNYAMKNLDRNKMFQNYKSLIE